VATIAPDPAAIAAAIVIADIVHELRRAKAAPIYRINRGKVAASHAAARAFGWLAPAPPAAQRLMLTEAGRRALDDAARVLG
jgi:hypothetical protein